MDKENFMRSNRGPRWKNEGYRGKWPRNRRHNENYNGLYHPPAAQQQSHRGPECSRIKYMTYNTLLELSSIDTNDLLTKISNRKDDFLNLINSDIENNKDIYILVVEILSKLCQSSFDELKLRLLLDVINSSFINNLRNYLMDLPYTETKVKDKNRRYWNNQNQFWECYIVFCKGIFDMAPSITMNKCRSLIEATSKLCLEELNTRHAFKLSEENQIILTELRGRVIAFEQKDTDEKGGKASNATADVGEQNEPPENFRELSVVPSRDDLLICRPFLRENVVQGAYRDIEHYLDVQFRLLREDCYGPLRDGLLQYIDDPNRRKYDNIRVYRNVRFGGPFVNKNNIGVVMQLDKNDVKRFKNINWAHNKRLLYGSLLLFSNDNCRSFIVATIIDRDVPHLAEGRIPISIVETSDAPSLGVINSNDTYVMIESEVYYEPYYHVLKALKDKSFPQNIAMTKYIINVEPAARLPKYVTEMTHYKLNLKDSKVKFHVMQPDTWPSHNYFGFNESQYEAYKLALTQEFAVIQGPPGTGKTFLGAKVAETLLRNIPANNGCLLLVICYTNHALDQFLEHILAITDSIVRIGSQSRNPAMAEISLNLRRQLKYIKYNQSNALYRSEKHNLSLIISELQRAQNNIQSLRDGVVSYESIREYIPAVNDLERFYKNDNRGDVITKWLFQHMPHITPDENIFDQYNVQKSDMDDERNERTASAIEDSWDSNVINIEDTEIKTSFLLIDAERKLSNLIPLFKNCYNTYIKQDTFIKICDLFSRISFFKEMRNSFKFGVKSRIIRGNMNVLANVDRWYLYFTWTNKIIDRITEQIRPLQEKVNAAISTYDEARMNVDLELLRNTKVIGMTTSGAARLRKLLLALAPPIVIVEEAAEVLEQHIITSLTSKCQHLILIGDHQQLRPSAAYLRLARHYNIEVSLFERMMLNGMHSCRLDVQHRMRPDIAALISPHIYPELINHPSVENYPHVRGITADLFFFTHDNKEESVDDSASRSNHKEADMTLGLANYLMQQDYKPEDVTILTAYSGQMFYMKNQRQNYPFLNNVKITVVDNYQGEESKIILLSLVRNNDQNNIGFLGTANRICVALSRAKEGFYIFGNIEILKASSPLWTNISKTLEDKAAIGSSLTLKCESHSDQVTMIVTPKDFEKVPEGGCLLKCNQNFRACGHPCPRMCHGYDREHIKAACQLQCERVICDLGHVCPLKCAQECEPCKQLIAKTLPCEHIKEIFCHEDPDDSKIKCTTNVTVTLVDCGHEVKKPCFQPMKYVKCTSPCIDRVDSCGHQCRRRCHVNDDPDHDKYVCYKPCAKRKQGCTADLQNDSGDHQCLKKCHEICDNCNVKVNKKRSQCKHSERVLCCQNVDEKPCFKKCARIVPICGHHCKKRCSETCDCDQKVNKIIPECRHSIRIRCKEEPKREMCLKPCERKLSCGHSCRNHCGQNCDVNTCSEIIDVPIESPCGHKVKLPCKLYSKYLKGSVDREEILGHCRQPCNTTLKCDHPCGGTCSQCLQGRLHVPCTKACESIMICGHKCEEPCNQVCLPCKIPCEVKCTHSKCKNTCGAPCVPCQEQCRRSCAHGWCTRRCGERCSRAPCDERCQLKLPCGHPCRGLCGEPCPPICKQCRPDDFPKDFLGDDFEDDAKFIRLQDCTHVLEVEDADNLMRSDKETITIRSCPFCRKPIINTYRYKDLINEMYKTQINPIKERVYGTKAQVIEKRDELSFVFSSFEKIHKEILRRNICFSKVVTKLYHTFVSNKKLSVLQLDMYFIYFDILNMIGNYHKEYNDAKLTHLKAEFLKQITVLCNYLKNCIKKISQQQQEDIGREIKRMNSIIQLSKILSRCGEAKDSKVKNALEQAKSRVIFDIIYNEDIAVSALKEFEKAVKLSGIITKQERALIVRAMNFPKQGHWYKCPNGHIYCITECGGATQLSKCNECGEIIGGQNHRLVSTNAVAGEMDGARHSAWSEQNNMANFDLNFD